MRRLTKNIVLIVFFIFAVGCSSTKSLEIAVDAQNKVEAHNREVAKSLKNTTDYIKEIRDLEAAQWNGWVKTISDKVNELDSLLKAIEADPKPEFLSFVSEEIQKRFRQIVDTYEDIKEYDKKVNNRFTKLASLKDEALKIKNKANPENDINKLKNYLLKIEDLRNQAESIDPLFKRTLAPRINSQNASVIKNYIDKDILGRFNRQVEFYSKKIPMSTARTQKLEKRIQSIHSKKNLLNLELQKLIVSKNIFLSKVEETLLELKRMSQAITTNAQVASTASRQVVESIQKDIAIRNTVMKIADIALKATTGLSMANIISEKDASKITQLLDTTGQIIGITTAEAKQESKKVKSDLKEIG